MRKILLYSIVLSIVLSLVFLGIQASASFQTTTKVSQPDVTRITTYEDDLDQSMTECDGEVPIGRYVLSGNKINISLAQSFIPQREVLTRTYLYMARNSTATQPCVVALRDSLTGGNLASVKLDASAFPVYDPLVHNFAWIEFDLPDLWVTSGQPYYLVLYTANMTDNCYWIGGHGFDLYPNGSAFISINDGATWQEFTDGDGCFKTYGLEETFLEIYYEPPLFSFLPGSLKIKNIGNVTAWDIVGKISITGGIFGRVNKTIINTLDRLDPGEEAILTLSTGLLFGFGQITIKLSISAANVREISISRQAFLLLFYIIIK
ncbi:MAG: hypothetical protein QXL17_07245 [Candidatus Thermoplasmatota archaeon]